MIKQDQESDPTLLFVLASTCTDEEAGRYTSYFSYSNLVSVFCAPIGGMFTDYLVRRAKRGMAFLILDGRLVIGTQIHLRSNKSGM